MKSDCADNKFLLPNTLRRHENISGGALSDIIQWSEACVWAARKVCRHINSFKYKYIFFFPLQSKTGFTFESITTWEHFQINIKLKMNTKVQIQIPVTNTNVKCAVKASAKQILRRGASYQACRASQGQNHKFFLRLSNIVNSVSRILALSSHSAVRPWTSMTSNIFSTIWCFRP